MQSINGVWSCKVSVHFSLTLNLTGYRQEVRLPLPPPHTTYFIPSLQLFLSDDLWGREMWRYHTSPVITFDDVTCYRYKICFYGVGRICRWLYNLHWRWWGSVGEVQGAGAGVDIWWLDTRHWGIPSTCTNTSLLLFTTGTCTKFGHKKSFKIFVRKTVVSIDAMLRVERGRQTNIASSRLVFISLIMSNKRAEQYFIDNFRASTHRHRT